MMDDPIYTIDGRISSDVAGVDEAGRGPLAGPVIAAAVILDAERPISGLKDSKQLSPKKRDQLFDLIINQAKSYAIGRAEPEDIDQLNILQATLLAMRRAVMGLSHAPTYVLIDGTQAPHLPFPLQTVVRGDSKIASIAAASIIAKVTRDREMIHWDKVYPEYGFAKHKGYPTKAHIAVLKQKGITSIHRKSFKPIHPIISNT